VHTSPEDNFAELRLFYSTTIGYFAKLQDQYLQKELEVKRLRRYICALEFRHLLEHLTPPCQPGTPFTNPAAGPRWEQFWKKALEDEATENASSTLKARAHALKAIADARIKKRGTLDRTGKIAISEVGQNGQVFREGKELYGRLSDNIHMFPAREFAVEGDWDPIVGDILRALKPLESNIDPVTGEVDWVEERKRILT